MDRRDFIKLLGLAGSSAAAFAACSSYMQEALADSAYTIDDLLTASAECKHGSLADIEHVVFLMQENRSFDHYFGTLRGVRGFGDPRPLRMRDGEPVWHQNINPPGNTRAKPYRLPNVQGFKPDSEASQTHTVGNVFVQDPLHDYDTGIDAWNHGLSDQWIAQKSFISMAHYTEADIPLYFKLAKAFTLCDSYFCSINGPTDPNRSYFWSGTANGQQDNDYFSLGTKGVNDWRTYPERLQDLGIGWKIYQDGLGWLAIPFAGIFGDNSLAYFPIFSDPTKEIHKKGLSVNSVLRIDANKPSQFEQDILDNKLPAVSWIVAPEAFTEHPKFSPHFGEYYLHEILRAFAANKELWKKTVFIITYDENGGFFDHVLPPVPPILASEGKVSAGIKVPGPDDVRSFDSETPLPRQGISAASVKSFVDSFLNLFKPIINPKTPLGMGMRVPTLVISPWSAGGRVCSEVFDHTSCLMFLDSWTKAKGLQAKSVPTYTNISSWRQAIAGDLTSALDFNRLIPLDSLAKAVDASDKPVIFTQAQQNAAIGTGAFVPTLADVTADPDYDKPVRTKQDMARCDIVPVGYNIQALISVGGEKLHCSFRNRGTLGAAFYLMSYDNDDQPRRYSVAGTKTVSAPVDLVDALDITQRAGVPAGNYSYAIHGPNGYMFEFRGNTNNGALAEIIGAQGNDEWQHDPFHIR